VRRHIITLISLTWITAGSLHAGTFDPTPIAPDMGVDVLNRGIAHERLGRDLFSAPYATVTIGNVDVYDVAPYLEARRFQVVSDPGWNRLVFGEVGKSLHAFDGAGTAFGALSGPRGMASDESNRLYVADAGNNRVLVLRVVTEFDDIRLVPEYAITGLSRPHGVAHSDAGTPFAPDDDVLYVADTGRNRVRAYALESGAARLIAEIGDLGSGPGRFAGPMAVAAGRAAGTNTADVYVADAHTQRIVRLRHDATGFTWAGEISHDADIVTSLSTDQWGNVYAAAPNRGAVRKYNPSLAHVADIKGALERPRDFHVPFMSVRDHRSGESRRVGQPNGLLVEQWSDASGVTLWNLGVEIAGLTVAGETAPEARFALTDMARVTMEISDPASGRVITRRTGEPLAAGPHTMAITAEDMNGAGDAGSLLVRLTAASGYANGPSDVATATFAWNGRDAVILPTQPMLLGNSPNPFRPSTRMAFMLPDGAHRGAALRVFDAQGRVVRTFAHAFVPGRNDVTWDGSDDAGHVVPAGIYFYRLDVLEQSLTHKMVLIR
jgi:hypothetical protein